MTMRVRLMAGVFFLALLVLLFLLPRGPGRPKFVEVEGQVLVNGKPGDNLRIEFHPDAHKGTEGPWSVAETDAEGRFQLFHATPDASGSGAAVGWHKVVVQDLNLSASETGQGVPIRLSSDYAAVLTTPLEIEVKEDMSSLKIELPLK
jgi:hypothetical protein